ncbi:MAG: glutathione synthase [Gammaproteobacteria bacterium]
MTLKIGVVMDPIDTITVKKDTTLAMLLAAQKKNWPLYYFEQRDLYLRDGRSYGRSRRLRVADDPQQWYEFQGEQNVALDELDVILMRKDPPFDMDYIYTTYLLERAEERGVLVVNRPQALRDVNEKLFTAVFPQCSPPSLFSYQHQQLKAFIAEHGDVIVKPPEGMGGSRIFRLQKDDPNINVVLETLTDHGRHIIIAQRYLPEIKNGDKRILLIDGEPVPYALARMPTDGETRANLAAGGTGVGVELSERDRWICAQVGPHLRDMGLLLVGLDVIGDYLTEINVTSPTCMRELDAQYKLDIGTDLMNAIERKRAIT